jgi:lysophospholipase L1-like esterase
MVRKFSLLLLCITLLVSCTPFDSSKRGKLNKVKQSGIELKNDLSASFFPRELNIVAAGDSLTLGVGSSSHTGGYIPYLETMLEQEKTIKKVNVANYGVKGNRADQLLARLSGEGVISSMKDADMIILTVGGNDLMQVVKDNFSSLELEHFLSERESFNGRLHSIIGKIRSSNDHAPIVLIGLYNPFFNWFTDVKEMNQIVDE